MAERDFALFWLGRTTLWVGDWLLRIALPLYVFSRTGSTTSTALIFMSATLPALLLGPVAGALVDRWNRRRVMLLTDLGRASVLGVLLAEPARHLIWLVFGVAAVQGCLSQLFAAANSSVLPALVPNADLVAANSAVTAGSELALLGGPVLGGVIYTFAGLRLSVTLDMASYLVSVATIAAIRSTAFRRSTGITTTDPHSGSVRADLINGLRYTCGHRALRSLIAVSALASLGGGLLTVLIVAFARGYLHASGTEYGTILSAQAVGGLGGAFLAKVANRSRASPRLAMLVSRLLIAVAVAVLALTTTWWAAAACLAFGGMPTTIGDILSGTLLQTLPPDSHRGRVAGLCAAAAALGLVLGAPIAGILAATVGSRASIEIAAGVFAASGLPLLARFP